jgi:phosphatidylglycerophosphatase C
MMSTNKKTLVIFDFCETLVNFQTADHFVNYIFQKKPSFFGICVEILRQFLKIFRLGSGDLNKRLQLLKIKNLDYGYINIFAKKYFEEILCQSVIPVSLSKFEWHKKQGHFIIIISGGYMEYINYFSEHFKFDKVIATELKTKNGKFTGKISGLDCMGYNKLIKLNNTLNLEDYDLTKSYCYTDSLSDLPILSLVGNRFLISTAYDKKICQFLNIEPIL